MVLDEEQPEDASEFRREVQPVRATATHVEGEMCTVTAPSGERAYIGRDAAAAAPPPASRGGAGSGSCALLRVPMRMLLRQVEDAQRAKIKGHQEKLDRMLATEVAAAADAHEQPPDAAKATELWVDKYAPTSFTELLSDERANRELLRWLGSWQGCTGATPKGGQQAQAQEKRRGAEGGADSDGRPSPRVVLLCGAPGLGKTTLANVAAAHCGYRVVEINASDERQASAIKKRVTDSVQMQSVIGDSRPNCVVIDEIDGLLGGPEGRGAVDVLLGIINAGDGGGGGDNGAAEAADKAEAGTGKGGGVKKKKKKAVRLMRPIVCICNDIYAPALRRLREQALVLRFDAPPASALVPRLSHICRKEGFLADKRALHALAEKAEGDVRSCLNTLQTAKAGKTCLKLYDVANLPIGRKDRAKGLFELLARLMQAPEYRKRKGKAPGERRGAGRAGAIARARRAEFDESYAAVEDADAELVLTGLMENLEEYRYRDADLKRSAEAAEWASYGDLLSGTARLRGVYSAMRYMPAATLGAAIAVHDADRCKPRFPRAHTAVRRGAAESAAYLEEWRQALSPVTQSSIGAGSLEALQTDYASTLLRVSNPKLAPNAFGRHVREGAGGDVVGGLVDTMLGYGISYRPVQRVVDVLAEEDVPMVMQPPLRRLCTFGEQAPTDARTLSDAVRRVLQAEARNTAIRRGALGRRGDTADGEDKAGRRQSGAAEAMAVVDKYKAIKDKRANAAAEARKSKSMADQRPVLFHYNEGFTNAVRRPVSVLDLLMSF